MGRCGIYLKDLDNAIERWRWESDRVGAENAAVMFGAAVGEVAPDPVLPDDAFRSPRWAILATLVPPASTAAGPLRKRYGVNVHMKKISPAAMRDVRNAVRADLRRASASGFFETLSAEPLYPDGDGHIMDRSPERFGWCVWRFHPDRRALSDPDSRALLRAAETRAGAVYFEDDEGPGLNYVTSGFYRAQRLGGVQQAYADAGWSDADVQFAATFGIAEGAITPEPGTALVASQYLAVLLISAGDDRNQPAPLRRPQRNPAGVVAVTTGTAKDVTGAGGGVVVVAVAPSLIWGSDPVPACSLAMTTPTAPTATSALAPMAADNSLTLFCVFEFTLTTPFGSGPYTMRRGVALMVQVQRGYLARLCKTPEMSV